MVEMFVDIIVKNISNSKYKMMNIDNVYNILEEGMGDKYDKDVATTVKSSLMYDDRLDFFKEDTYIVEHKFYYCTGNWIAIKGTYNDPVTAKSKMGMYSWQRYKGEEIID